MLYKITNKNLEEIASVSVYLNIEWGDPYLTITSEIYVKEYSRFLLENLNKSEDIISDFDIICNFRNRNYEIDSLGNTIDSEYRSDHDYEKEESRVNEIISSFLQSICEKYDLEVVAKKTYC